uniref:Purple acid phosphatase n=1 Tax=Oryza meridionalis TaxID=40149 RepID=A0A0E0F6H7_9ORYZ
MMIMMRCGLSVATVVVAVVMVGVMVASPVVGELARVEHPTKEDGSLAVLVVGDWGRKGQYNQTLVATQMGVIGEELAADFILSTGDNFYNDGLTGDNDTASFQESFTNIYTADSLQKPWYIVLGNHDYTGDALAQQSPAIRAVDSRWTSINKSFIVDSDIAEFFLVDTVPFVQKYWNESKFDWRQVAPRDTYLSTLLTDLGDAMSQSNATWKIVVGHHTISSGCEHGNTTDLVAMLLPVLKTYGADMYINGHDHCLQRITSIDSPLEFITSGGGSRAWAGKFKQTSDKLEFIYDGQGFLSMQLTMAEASFAFYDVTGAVLYSWQLTKSTSTN